MAEAYVSGSGGGGGNILYIGPTQPNASLGYRIWINTSNSTMLYWNGSAWVQLIAVWG